MTKDKVNDLIQDVRAGNRSAFGKLYNEYYPKMFYVAMGVTHNREDACDAVQQAFIKFWKYVIESDRPYLDYPNAYLYTVTRRCAYDVVQKNMEFKSVGSMETLATVDADDGDMSQTDFKLAVEKFKEPEKTIAEQFFLFDMKIKEIADKVGEPVGTVKWRISEIRKNLQNILK